MGNKIEFTVLGDVKDLEDKLKKSKKAFDDFGKAGGIAFAGLTATAVGFINAAREEEQAINQLNQALENQGKFTEQASKDLQDYASSLEGVSLFTDESIIKAEALIAAFGLEGQTLKDATKATLDLAQAKGIDLASAADLVGKSIGSSTNALARYGIAIDGAAGSTARAAGAIQGINRLYGGQAEAATKGLGSTIVLKNALSNLADEIGFALAPTVIKITKNLKEFTDTIKDNPELTKLIANVIILGIQVSAAAVAISLIAKLSFTWATANAYLSSTIILLGNNIFTLGQALRAVSLVGASAFVGWKVGELISDVTGLTNAIKGLGAYLGELQAQRSLGAAYISEEEFNKAKESWAKRKALIDEEIATNKAKEQSRLQLNIETNKFIDDSADQLKQIADVRTQTDLQDLMTKFQNERQALIDHITLKEQILDANGLLDVAKKEQFEQEILDINNKYDGLEQAAKDAHNSKLSALDQKALDLYKKVNADKVGTLTSTLQQAAQLNKDFANAYKVVAIGDAFISTSLAVMHALKDLPFPANIGVASLLAAKGAVEIATIQAQQFAVGTPKIPRDMNATVHKDEMIVPATFSEAIRSGDLSLSGPGAGGNPNLSTPSILFDFTNAQFNGITDTFIRDVFTKASENIANKTLAFRGVA